MSEAKKHMDMLRELEKELGKLLKNKFPELLALAQEDIKTGYEEGLYSASDVLSSASLTVCINYDVASEGRDDVAYSMDVLKAKNA